MAMQKAVLVDAVQLGEIGWIGWAKEGPAVSVFLRRNEVIWGMYEMRQGSGTNFHMFAAAPSVM